MIVNETDLFKGISRQVIDKIVGVAIEEVCPSGMTLFEQGDEARHFFILEEGNIDIYVGQPEGGGLHFTAKNAGDVFGWSAMVQPHVFTANGRCMTDARIIKIPRSDLHGILQQHPRDGFIIMQRLAGLIAQRLRRAYQTIAVQTESQGAPSTPSYG
jgi:CRP-like cAMP-binding protein